MQITDHVHLLKIDFQVSVSPELILPRSVNLFPVSSRSRALLVDSGVAGCTDAIIEYLRGMGLEPAALQLLVLTHSHPDHIGGAAPLQERTGCRIAAHKAARPWIQNTRKQAKERPVPGFDRLVAGPVKVNRLLADGDRLELEGLVLEVLHTPGHSSGSVSLHLREDRVLICGDAVPRPGDLPIFINWQASMDSLDRLESVEEVEILLSAWDRPRRGPEIGEALQGARKWLRLIKEVVEEEALKLQLRDPMALCAAAVSRLGLPPVAVNPLVARSFAGCL